MRLYHGSNVAVRSPDLNLSKKLLDFGGGFYLTTDFEQAKQWARIKTNRAGKGSPIVSIFEMQEDDLAHLKVTRFNGPDRAWLDCITDHRKGFIERDEEDVIIGPVANDQTFQTIGLYFRGFITAEMALQLLLPQNLRDQYCIKTEKALACLVFKEVKRL